MASHRHHVATFLLGAAWTGVGVWRLIDGENVIGALYLTFGAYWILMGFFGDRVQRRQAAALERQRARVEGFNAITFRPDTGSRAQDE